MGWVIAAAIMIAAFAATYYLAPKPKLTAQEWGKDHPTAEEGRLIPVLFGRRRIQDPNITYFGDTSVVEDKNYGDGVYRYYAGVQFCLCHGAIDGISQVIVGGKVVWQGACNGSDYGWITLTSFFTGSDGVAGTLLMLPGNIAEGPDDGYDPTGYIVQAMKLPFGKGPRFKGVANVQLHKPWIGSTPTLKPWAFEATRIHRRQGGTEVQWYDEKSEIKIGRDRTDTWKYWMQDVVDGSYPIAVNFDDSGWSSGPGGFGNAPANGGGVGMETIGVNYKTPNVGTCIKGIGGYSGGSFPNLWVTSGVKLWVRQDLGALPAQDLGVRLWHDDEARCWFNGEELDCFRIESAKDSEYWLFNSKATIPASLINPSGPNVIAFRVKNTGSGGSIQRIYAGIQIGPDMDNPTAVIGMNGSHIIRECLTDRIFGFGCSEEEIDGDSFTASADQLYDERIGLSFEWTESASMHDFITEVLRHINGVLYVDGETGKFKLDLVRNDYDVEDLLTLDYSNVRRIEDFARKGVRSLVNSVTATFVRPDNTPGSVTVHNNGQIQNTGGNINHKADYPGFSDLYAATRAAFRDLRALGSPLITCKIYANRKAWTLRPGKPFILDWPAYEVDQVVMRVESIEFGDATDLEIVITAVEDVFHVPASLPAVPSSGVDFPTIPLGPLPGAGKETKYFPVKRYDSRNRGQVTCVFTGYEGCGGEHYLFNGWSEISPGVMRNNTTGILTSAAFDGVDTDTSNKNGSQMIGRLVMATGNYLSEENQKRQGLYRIRDLGGHYELIGYDGETGEPIYQFVTTQAILERDPDYSTSEDYVPGMVFQVQAGNYYGTAHFELANAVILDSVAQEWNLYSESPTFPWVEDYALLTEPELATEPVSVDTLDESVTYLDGNADMPNGFPMLSPLGIRSIDSGTWSFVFEGVWLTALVPDTETCIGIRWHKSDGSVGETVFEALSPPITATTPTPLRFEVKAPRYLLEENQFLVAIPFIHTNAVVPVTLNCRFTTPNFGTYFTIPLALSAQKNVRAKNLTQIETWSASNVLIIPGGATSADVNVDAGTELVGVTTDGFEDGAIVVVTIFGATPENPIVLKHAAEVPNQVGSFFLSSERGQGGTYEDLPIYADETRVILQRKKTTNTWALLGVMG